MRIVLDAMGSDTCPQPEILGAVEASQTFGDPVILVGPADQLKRQITALAGEHVNIEIVDAPDQITMEDKGLKLALKAKRKGSKNSMAVGIDLVNQGDAQAFVTAGNTGGALTTAFFRMGVLPGVERPALTGLFPVRGGYCVVLDIGANPDCKPIHMVQFAIMGRVYARIMRGIQNPRVSLLSNGEEAGKGNDLVKETYPLLEASDLNFTGNIEGKELFGGETDVAVTDGFTGNVVLKVSEAVADLLVSTIRQELTATTRTKIGGLLAQPAFYEIRKMMDPAEVGAIPLLGINGLVFIGHGRSNATAIFNAIRAARQAVQADLLNSVSKAISTQFEIPPAKESA